MMTRRRCRLLKRWSPLIVVVIATATIGCCCCCHGSSGAAIASPVDSTAASSTGEDNECRAFSKRRFLTQALRSEYGMDTAPPLLWSTPGSGNTLARLLIEYATGFYTGSVYDDPTLASDLPGESCCNASVVAIKAHPLIIPGEKINVMKLPSAAPLYNVASTPHRYCKDRDALPAFEKAIILVRNPVDAIWAEYQRYYASALEEESRIANGEGSLRNERNHITSMGLDEFLAHPPQKYLFFLRKFKLSSEVLSHFVQENPGKFLIVKYEDLLNPHRQLRVMTEILFFLRVHFHKKRVECAFRQERLENIHRTKKVTGQEVLAALPEAVFDQFILEATPMLEAFGYSDTLEELRHLRLQKG